MFTPILARDFREPDFGDDLPRDHDSFDSGFVQSASASNEGLGGVADKVKDILGTVVSIVMVLALIYFFVGLAKYILAAGDEEKGAGRGIMINGVIALFVMASVWGLVTLVGETIGVEKEDAPTNLRLIPNNL